jgi:transposase-like protein
VIGVIRDASFVTALGVHGGATEVVTDRAWTLFAVVDELLSDGFHDTARHAHNRIKADHGRSKRGPMRGLKHDDSARVIVRVTR